MINLNDFLSLITRISFLLISALTLFDYLRYRDRTRLDIALMFGSLGLIFVVQVVTSVTGIQERWLTTIGAVAIMAQPYLLLRLVEHFRPVPRVVRISAIAGMVASATILIAVPTPLPSPLTLLIVAYFAGVEFYAAQAFVRGSFTTRGVARRRLSLVAAGSGFLAAAVLVAGINSVVPGLAGALSWVPQFLAVLAAVGYYFGFAPPRLLRRVWQHSELYSFVREAYAHPGEKQTSQILELLCEAAIQATGGMSALAALWDDKAKQMKVEAHFGSEPVVKTLPLNEVALRQSWEEQRPILAHNPVEWRGEGPPLLTIPSASAVFIIPIIAAERALGLLLVFLWRPPLFPDDDLDLLSLFAEQASLGLDYASLLSSLEQRVAERTEALRKSENQLSLVYRHVSDIIFYLGVEPNEKFRLLSVNPAFSEATGLTESQVVGKLVQEVIPEPSLSTVVLPNYREAIRDKKTVQWEEVSVYPTGTKYGIVAVTPIFDANGQCTNLVGAVHDITDSRQAEEEIRRLNAELEQRVIERTAQLEAANKKLQMFAALAESSYDFVSMATMQGEIFYLNRYGRDLVGLGPDEELPKALEAYCEPDTWELIAKEGLPRLQQEGRWSGEGRLRNFRTGAVVDIHMSAFIIRDPVTGGLLCLGAIDRNITDRKQAEVMLAQRSAELEAANKELEAFAYSVSHDLRAPLRSIDGFSQVLLEDYAGKLDEQAKDYLQRVRAGSQRMAQLIDDLLQLSRVTRSEMHREKVDLTAVAWSITQELQRAQPERRIEFAIAPEVVAEGDPRLLRVVLENLLNNAWKFTGQHPAARVEFGVMDGEGEKVYFVRDDGVGFDMAYADKLFGAFQRLHGSSEFSGTGIGLATVQRIIHRHGGRVWAEGEVGKGATFYFTLT